MPLTQKARSYLGANTEWCTTYGEYCLNDDYKYRTPVNYDNLWILINEDDQKEKYQFHFGTEQFMDINLSTFLFEHEEVHEFFMKKFDVDTYNIKDLLEKAP